MSNDEKKVAFLLASAISNLVAALEGPVTRVRVRAHTPFSVPPREGPVKHPRTGTRRALLENLMSGRGSTLETIMRRTKWDRRNALANIRAMDRLGYGIEESASSGRIRLTLPADHEPAPVWG